VDARHQETTPAREGLRRLWTPVHVAQEVGAGLAAGPLLQRPLPYAEGRARMRRDFADRHGLESYLRSQFAFLTPEDTGLSPIRGGRLAALDALAAINPGLYARTRNHLDGAVSRLSMYIRHGVLSLPEVMRAALARVARPNDAYKFVQELAWRDYWQRLYHQLGEGIWRDREPYKTGYHPEDYRAELPPDAAGGASGLACMDAFVHELKATGYLHNHARMWFAAWVVHWLRVRWQAGARFFLEHLLDGDPASNNLSWQWVASTFSHKPYFFNRENLERYTGGRYCRECPRRGDCPFEGSYEALAERLFTIEAPR
jgi:deoxyribodipyrimidine photo-lyase